MSFDLMVLEKTRAPDTKMNLQYGMKSRLNGERGTIRGRFRVIICIAKLVYGNERDISAYELMRNLAQKYGIVFLMQVRMTAILFYRTEPCQCDVKLICSGLFGGTHSMGTRKLYERKTVDEMIDLELRQVVKNCFPMVQALREMGLTFYLTC